MTGIKHKKVVEKEDNPTKGVGKDEWNDEHNIDDNGIPDSSSFNANDITITTSASAFTAGNIAALHCVVKTGD
jgi:hypothetical protein